MVFDYIDGAAGEDEGAAARNRAALDAAVLTPRVCRDVRVRDLSTSLFGARAGLPFGVSPMGMCNLAGPGCDAALARFGARAGVPVGVSTAASTSLEEMARLSEGRAWFQLYWSGDGATSLKLVERAAKAGYETLIVTVDVPEVGRRPREGRRGFTMPFRIGPSQFVDFALHPRWSLTSLAAGKPDLANFGGAHGAFDRTETRAGADWDRIADLRAAWPGKMVLKGVLHPDDARRARDAGADAVQVSNHGGRQLASAPGAAAALPGVRAALGDDFPVFFDSGVTSGEDVVRALALGADYVFLGRVLLFAYAAAGEAGLTRMTDLIASEVSLTLAQLGLTAPGQVGRGALFTP